MFANENKIHLFYETSAKTGFQVEEVKLIKFF